MASLASTPAPVTAVAPESRQNPTAPQSVEVLDLLGATSTPILRQIGLRPCRGSAGRARLVLENLPSSNTPATSVLVPWAVLRCLAELAPQAGAIFR